MCLEFSVFKYTVFLYFVNVFFVKPYVRDVAILLKFRYEDECNRCKYVSMIFDQFM